MNAIIQVFLETSEKNIVGKKINSLFKNDGYFLSLIEKSIKSNRNINELNVSIHTTKKKIMFLYHKFLNK